MAPSSMGAQAGIIGQLVIESKSQTGKVALAFLFLSAPVDLGFLIFLCGFMASFYLFTEMVSILSKNNNPCNHHGLDGSYFWFLMAIMHSENSFHNMFL